MKAVLIAIKPKWVEKIASGKKTVEVRKSAPKEVPFKAYIYETYDKNYDNIGVCWGEGKTFEHGCKKVIGEFVCNKVKKYEPHVILCACYEVNGADVKENLRYNKGTCLSYEDMVKKSNGKPLYGWHISDLKIYDKPRELSEFSIPCKTSCETCKRPLFYGCWE